MDELVASEVPRTTQVEPAGTTYTFEIPVDAGSVPGGTFHLGVFVPAENASGGKDVVTPNLGVGSDARGAFLILNQFDQDLLITGGMAVIGAAACVLPGIGWVSCGVIQAALAVASVALGQLPTPCPDQAKVYLFQQYDRVGCYP